MFSLTASLGQQHSALREQRPMPDYSVVLTFEEAYRNFLTVAAPCLADYGLPATVFVFPNSVPEGSQSDNSRSWLLVDDDRNLSWEELDLVRRELGIEVGLLLRPVLDAPALTRDDAIRQLRKGYVDVVKHTGQPGAPLAFRYGEYTLPVAREASLIGFSCAIARCDFGVNEMADDPFALQRILARDIGDDSLAAFAVHISSMPRARLKPPAGGHQGRKQSQMRRGPRAALERVRGRWRPQAPRSSLSTYGNGSTLMRVPCAVPTPTNPVGLPSGSKNSNW